MTMTDWYPLTIPILLAQTQAEGALPPPPGTGQPVTTNDPGVATTTPPQQQVTNNRPPPNGLSQGFVAMIVLVFVAMIAFSFMGQRRDRKKRQVMLGAIKKHDRVQTIGGVIGSIVELKPDTVVLKVDESSNTRITFSRSAIQQVVVADQDITMSSGRIE